MQGDYSDLVEQAQNGSRTAVEALLIRAHPVVRRLALSLCGDERSAGRVIDVCFRHAINVLPGWSGSIDPQNWFTHHVLQTSRQECRARPEAEGDVLATALPAGERSPPFLAVVRAIRRLPPQQAEAFLLHHAESLNARLIGVAMDCSMQAASTHLLAADNELKALVGDDFQALVSLVRRACQALTPTPSDSVAAVAPYARTFQRARRRRRLLRAFVAAALLALCCYAGWRLLRGASTPAPGGVLP